LPIPDPELPGSPDSMIQQQAATPSPAKAPQAPNPPQTRTPAADVAPGPVAGPVPGQGVPTTRGELEGLIAKRAELTEQLESLTERREELTDQRANMGREESIQHDARIRLIDDRSARVEQEILQADQAIADAYARGVATRPSEGQSGTMVVTDQVIHAIRSQAEDAVFESFMILAMMLVGATLVWRGIRRVFRRKKPGVPAAVTDPTARFDQLQASMDVIAIEVERISEAQRYVAKLMNERATLGAGEAQPVAANKKPAPVKVRRDGA
jgi:hypothetical protein